MASFKHKWFTRALLYILSYTVSSSMSIHSGFKIIAALLRLGTVPRVGEVVPVQNFKLLIEFESNAFFFFLSSVSLYLLHLIFYVACILKIIHRWKERFVKLVFVWWIVSFTFSLTLVIVNLSKINKEKFDGMIFRTTSMVRYAGKVWL